MNLKNVLVAVWLALLIGSMPFGISTRADDGAAARFTDDQITYFESKVRPVLVEHCYACHSAKAEKLKAGFLIDSRQGILKGGDSGPAIFPGDVDASLLVEAIRYESYEMPPKGKLPADTIAVLEEWVRMGAPWPAEAAHSADAARAEFDLLGRKSNHWAWRPVSSPTVPEVDDACWPLRPLDHFILRRLETAGLRPAADADRYTLVRRVYFDLIGLPPTPEQVQQFVNDDNKLALGRLVDELLDSPHFGERWGRHWLDLVRYAESRGHEFDNDTQNAYQYRDYIIRALNADVPYDQLIREHIAGDLLDHPRLNPEHGFNESILGTGFWFLGEWVHSPVDIRKDETDRFDNMIDVMSKTFLGVTVSCARCHDHKFDAISTTDYYSLSGFLQSSDFRQVCFESLEHNRAISRQLSEVDRRFRQQVAQCLSQAGMEVAKLDQESIRESLQANVLVDYGSIEKDEFQQDGFLFGDQPRAAGEIYVIEDGDEGVIRLAERSAAATDPAWYGLKSLSEKGVHSKSKLDELRTSGRTLRTPTFTLQGGIVHCRVRGRGHVVACVDSHRLVAGPLHGETIEKIEPDRPWTQLNLQRYLGHRLHLEFTPAEDSPMEVTMVVRDASPEKLAELEQYEAAIEEKVRQRAAKLESLLATDNESARGIRTLAHDWLLQRTALKNAIQSSSKLAMAMMDGTGEDDHVLIRGSSANPGAVAPRRFLEAITGDSPMNIGSGSGRLQLAEQICDPANPLTSRVIVNRIWHHLLGRGIVPTTDDFGVLGQRPTHPELLDYLATRFLSAGRSIKNMIREIVLSRTYQISDQVDSNSFAADANNMLWHHRPPKRLEGEAIRDALLAVSGQLDKTMFGEPVPIHLTDFMDGRGRPEKSGPVDGDRRRSIYVAVRRNFLSPFMLAFDAPIPFSTMGRRNESNVPAQALILMNDPMVVAQSRKWAERALGDCRESLDTSNVFERLDWMYLTAFSRHATDRERQAAAGFLSAQATEHNVAKADAEIWASLAHALVNTKEFIFLR